MMVTRKPLPFLLDELSPHLRRTALSAIFGRPSTRSARVEIYERPFTIGAADSGEWVVKDMTSHTGIIGKGFDLLSLLAYLSGSDVGSVACAFLSPLMDFQSDLAAQSAAVVARWQARNERNTIMSPAPKRLAHHIRIDASTPGRLAHLIAPPIAKRVLNRRYNMATFEISSLGDVIAQNYDLPMSVVACRLIGATFAIQFDPVTEAEFNVLSEMSETAAASDAASLADLFPEVSA